MRVAQGPSVKMNLGIERDEQRLSNLRLKFFIYAMRTIRASLSLDFS
jgi:hypothetical protein